MENKQTKIWNPAFITILVVNFCVQMGQQMTNTLVPKYADSLGATAYIVGIVGSIFAVASILIRPIASPAFDSFSKKKFLSIAIAGFIVVLTCYGLAKSIPIIIAARLLHGMCLGCAAPLSLAITSNSLPDNKIGKGIGIFTLTQAVGQAVGPNMGLTLSLKIGYSNTFFIGAGLMAAALVISFFLKEPEFKREPYKIAFNKIIEKSAIHATILMFFFIFAYSCVNNFIAIYSGLRGIENIGMFFTVYAIFLLLTRPVSGILLDKYGYSKVLIPGIIMFGLAFFLISISKTMTMFLVAAAVSAFGYGVCYPTVQALAMSCAPKSRRGVASSTSFLGMDFGMLFGASFAGFFVDKLTVATKSEVFAYSRMYLLMIIPIALSVVYFLFARKKIQQTIELNNPSDS